LLLSAKKKKKKKEIPGLRYALPTHTAIAVQCDGFAPGVICGALGLGHGESYRLPDLLVLVQVMDGLYNCLKISTIISETYPIPKQLQDLR
jgi:hypothetical protein